MPARKSSGRMAETPPAAYEGVKVRYCGDCMEVVVCNASRSQDDFPMASSDYEMTENVSPTMTPRF
jgi:hypothetical protein